MGFQQRSRADRQRRSAPHRAHRQGAAGAVRAAARGRGRRARRRSRGRLRGHADEQQRLEQPDHGARLRRARARSHRALQSRDAGLLPGDGHADPRRTRHRAVRSPRRTEGRRSSTKRSPRSSSRARTRSARRSRSAIRAARSRRTLRDRRPGRRREVRQPARAAAADDVRRLGAGGHGVVGRAHQHARQRRRRTPSAPRRCRPSQSVHKEAVVDFRRSRKTCAPR